MYCSPYLQNVSARYILLEVRLFFPFFTSLLSFFETTFPSVLFKQRQGRSYTCAYALTSQKGNEFTVQTDRKSEQETKFNVGTSGFSIFYFFFTRETHAIMEEHEFWT